MARITGAREHGRRLARAREVNRAIVAALYTGGQMIEIEAENSITSGSVSGKNHVPSLPGQPPNADTRLLDTNIETTVQNRNRPEVHVSSNAPYASYLEFGTSKMAERPYMRPAARRHERAIGALVERAVSRIIRGR
jgi:HK97 gp10 family phage protein